MRGRRFHRRNQSDIYRRVGNNREIENRLHGITARVQISNTKARKYLFYSPLTKNPTRKSWIFSFVPIGTTSFAWHTQHHLTVRSTSLPFAAQMNEVEALLQMMLQQVAKDVMLRINDVALRANGIVVVCSVR